MPSNLDFVVVEEGKTFKVSFVMNNPIPTNIEARNAANDFHPDEKESEWEFLFTRAIEFRQETIYFIIVDRFFDGDSNNNPGPNPELYDPDRNYWGKYWGGDLQGIVTKLEYLKNLGVTAIWISPLFEQVESLQFEFAPMHGYWTKDFKRINPRFLALGEDNTLSECKAFRSLVDKAHQLKIKVILDIVCNHSSPDVNGEKGKLYDDGVLIADYYHDSNNWYYHNPEITDWENEDQLLHYEMMGLATFNESNIDYRNYMKDAIKQWLDQGIDALRIDTVKHMPLWFWQEFLGDLKTHRPDLFAFGEWGFGKPLDGKSAQFANESGMSILDFGLSGAIRECLGKNAEGGFHLLQDIFDLDYLYNTATELITFFDNHDMSRFGSLNPDGKALRLAVALIMTCRGIPCIYYGTEQYLHNDTNGGEDPYNRPMMDKWDTNTPIYRDLGRLSKLRRINPAVSLGSQIQKYLTDDIFCFLRCYRDYRCLVCFNKSYQGYHIDLLNTELVDGEYYCTLTNKKVEVINGNLHNLYLPPQEVLIFNYLGEKVQGTTIVRAQLNGIRTNLGEFLVVIGNCPELGNWDIEKGYRLEYINSNTWFGEISFPQSCGKAITYKYALVKSNGEIVRENRALRPWILANDNIAKWTDTWEK